MAVLLDRPRLYRLYGPMEGDLVHLADTGLKIRIERNLITHGEEATTGAGRNMRDGLGICSTPGTEPPLDLVILQAVVLDPVLGVVKADIGVRDGKIVGIGQAGNPGIQRGVTLPVGPTTMMLPANGLLATPGAIDTHVHFLSGRLMPVFLEAGFTTLIGGTPGPVSDVGVTPRVAFDTLIGGLADFPVNLALLGRASTHRPSLEAQLEFGCSGFKIHEDFGPFPAVIDATLSVADAEDVQVMIHTDTTNESATLADTLRAIRGRTIHAYHVEGAGGGHSPDILEIAQHPNILPSSTNPTNPYVVGSAEEQLDMIMSVHGQYREIVEDVAFAQSRIRPSTMMAEDLLHDRGAISMMGTDSNGMGRAGQTVRRTWQLAAKMVRLDASRPADDNDRVLRYLAKYTICPAVAHGIDEYVGSLQRGRLADIVLWDPAYFGVKPRMVVKCGIVSYAMFGSGDGSSYWGEPTRISPQWGGLGACGSALGRIFTSERGRASAIRRGASFAERLLACHDTRQLTKQEMPRNGEQPHIRVDTETFQVWVDGVEAIVPAADSVALNRPYWIA